MPRRSPDALRPMTITPHYLDHPEGSVLITCGDTKVICTASVEDKAPPWMQGKGTGWVTAEYDMLPRATTTRRPRDAQRGKINSRSQEIARLIGRALRAVVDLPALGERTICLDCDVIQADGGTRTAAITGAYVALAHAAALLKSKGKCAKDIVREAVAAISVGLVSGQLQLDLDYAQDSQAEVDMNVVMTEGGQLVEVQGTAEHGTFAREQLSSLVDLALTALPRLVDLQKRAVAVPLSPDRPSVSLCA